MDNFTKCVACKGAFGWDRVPRELLCKHCLCQACLEVRLSEKNQLYEVVCPADGKTLTYPSRELVQFPKQIQLINVGRSSYAHFELLDCSEINTNESHYIDDDSFNSCRPSDSPSSHATPMISSTNSIDAQELCQLHGEKLKNFCLQDGQRICSDCALFGKHIGHKITKLAMFEEQVAVKAKQLSALGDQLQERVKRRAEDVMGQLSNQLLKGKFCMSQQLKEIKQKILSKLQQLMRQIAQSAEKLWDERIRQISKHFDADFERKFQNWLRQVNELDLIHSSNSEQKLKFLNQSEELQRIGHQLQSTIKRSSISQKTAQIDFKLVFEQGLLNFGLKLQKNKIEDDKILTKHKPTKLRTMVDYTLSTNEYDDEDRLTERPKLKKLEIPKLNFQESYTAREKVVREKEKPSKNASKVLDRTKHSKKIPQKFEKHYLLMVEDKIEIIDFSFGQFQEKKLLQILQPLRLLEKPRSIKLMRNKLTDQFIRPLLQLIKASQIRSINLSQNLLTDRTVDLIADQLTGKQSLKSIILSQNKIVQRNVKQKTDYLKGLGISLSF